MKQKQIKGNGTAAYFAGMCKVTPEELMELQKVESAIKEFPFEDEDERDDTPTTLMSMLMIQYLARQHGESFYELDYDLMEKLRLRYVKS